MNNEKYLVGSFLLDKYIDGKIKCLQHARIELWYKGNLISKVFTDNCGNYIFTIDDIGCYELRGFCRNKCANKKILIDETCDRIIIKHLLLENKKDS
ncbi:MAG: hypothetical protein V8Q75_02090 [Bacilli bacterium]